MKVKKYLTVLICPGANSNLMNRIDRHLRLSWDQVLEYQSFNEINKTCSKYLISNTCWGTSLNKNIDFDDFDVYGFGSMVMLLINLIHWSRISFIIFHVCGLAATKAKSRKMKNIIFLRKTFPLTLIHYQYFALY